MASYELPIYCERRRRSVLSGQRKLLVGVVLLFFIFGFVASKGFGLFGKGPSDGFQHEINDRDEIKSNPPSPSASPHPDLNSPRSHKPHVPPPPRDTPQFRAPNIPSTHSSQVPPPSGSSSRGPNVSSRPSTATPNITDKTVTVSKIVPACPTRIVYSVDEDFEATVEVVEG